MTDETRTKEPAPAAEKPRVERKRPSAEAVLLEMLRQVQRVFKTAPLAEIDGDLRRIGEQIDHYLAKRA